MENNFFLIVLICIGFGAVLGVTITLLCRRWNSRQYRTKFEIPDIIGKWRCQWFDDSVDPEKPKVEDTVEFQRWTTSTEFIARGFQPEFHLSYPLVGEIDPSLVVTLSYKAYRYPYEPNRGVACLQLSRDGKTMEGHWFGRRFSGNISGGTVKCFRIDSPEMST